MTTDRDPTLPDRRAARDPRLQRLQSLRALIGRTPLLKLSVALRGRPHTVWAKAEHLNLTGSIKDRMALHILEQAILGGQLVPGAPIVEATSGNTGIAFSALGSALGHPVTIFMPDWMSQERRALIASYGARIVGVSKAEGGFLGSIAQAEAMAREHPHAYLPRQFANEGNVAAHRRHTGPELLMQLARQGLTPTAFVAGVGTGGTVMGVGQALRAEVPGVRVHPLEPAESPTLSTGHKVGQHRIQGISDEFIPAICRLDTLDAVIGVSDTEAIRMAQRLARELGLGLGISSGANLLGALRLADELGPEAVVCTVFSDDSKKYLSTDFARDCPACRCDDEVELLGVDVVPC